MTRREIIKYLDREGVTRDEADKEAFGAFVKLMRRFRYGPPQTAQAYYFFIDGWIMANKHRDTAPFVPAR